VYNSAHLYFPDKPVLKNITPADFYVTPADFYVVPAHLRHSGPLLRHSGEGRNPYSSQRST